MAERLPNASAFMEGVVNSADDAVVIYNRDESIISWNRVSEQLLGYSAHEILGQSIVTLIPPTRLDEEREALDRIAQGDTISD